MDLGIKERNAFLMASSSGLGLACAMALAEEGVNVWINGRNVERLEAAAAAIREKTGVRVTTVAADITDDAARKRVFESVPDIDILVTNMLPERIDTPRQQAMAKRLMTLDNIDYDEARHRIEQSVAAKRMGRPEEFGSACAYLCSAQAGFISGQNLQVDGGSYHGLIKARKRRQKSLARCIAARLFDDDRRRVTRGPPDSCAGSARGRWPRSAAQPFS